MDNKSLNNGGFIEKDQPKTEVKKAKKKEKKPNFFTRLGSKIKDVFSELKKVTWPTFPKTVKQTGVVIVVVLAFLVVIAAFDFGLMQLLELVSPKTSSAVDILSKLL